MGNKNKMVVYNAHDLLDIFPNEIDRMGTDILAMTDFYNVFAKKLEENLNSNKSMKIIKRVGKLAGEISTAIQTGYDISKSGVLVADYSHFSQEIVDGLKKGIYHIGQSKEVSGNLRPAILDEDGKLVKFFTLKKSYDSSRVLADISTMSIQFQLRQISMQIEDISYNLKDLVNSKRRIDLSNKFVYARDKIMQASSAESRKDTIQFLKEADTYLMEGLTNLYVDLSDQVKALSDIRPTFSSASKVDTILSYISEDMQMIPRYVALRVYLFNYQGKKVEACRVINEFKFQIKCLNNDAISKNNNSAFEIIHKYSRYDDGNIDFWLKEPINIINSISSYEKMMKIQNKNVVYIDVEEDESEEKK